VKNLKPNINDPFNMSSDHKRRSKFESNSLIENADNMDRASVRYSFQVNLQENITQLNVKLQNEMNREIIYSRILNDIVEYV